MNLYPISECINEVHDKLKKHSNLKIYQQFLCSGCGTKQTMEQENTFYLKGSCEECGETTNIQKNGCNYIAVIVFGDLQKQ